MADPLIPLSNVRRARGLETLLTCFVPALLIMPTACQKAPPPTVSLSISSDGDFLAFRPTELTVPAGAHVVLTFHHTGKIISQDHDWVLADRGAMPALLAASDRAAAAGSPEGKSFLEPADPRVIASTKMIGKGQTASIEFTAPPPGDYPFFCSTPGHAETMHGLLHVTAG